MTVEKKDKGVVHMTKVQRVFERLDINRAVFFGLLTKIWSLCSGPVTVVLITLCFSSDVQGYYYTFATLLALQVFIQLGLGTVIIQFASHEWAELGLDSEGHITGNLDALSRLSSIARIALKWYVIAGALVMVGVGLGGYFFFSTSPQTGVAWSLPWFLLCIVEGLSICLVPLWSLLEGCNQISRLYTFRFYQGFLVSLSIWVSMWYRAGLWTAGISASVYVLTSLFFLRSHYSVFIKDVFRSKRSGPFIDWRIDMLPMQWRIAISWVSGYFIFSLFVPTLFKYDGAQVAGQMGMTWSLVSVLGSVSSSWLSPKAPVFGMLIAKQEYAELNRQFWKTTRIVMGISALLALAMWITVYTANMVNIPMAHKFSVRILPPLPTGIFLLAQLLYIFMSPFYTYLRAHKREPLMYFSIIYAVLVATSTFLAGRYFSVTGMAAGYFIVNVGVMPFVYLIWKKCRREWHVPANVASI